MCEPLGSEVLVHWSTAAGDLLARLPGQVAPRPGATTTLHLPPEKLHCFDLETGASLARAR
jgi:ABC-type sugar transport system ATPase subunit